MGTARGVRVRAVDKGTAQEAGARAAGDRRCGGRSGPGWAVSSIGVTGPRPSSPQSLAWCACDTWRDRAGDTWRDPHHSHWHGARVTRPRRRATSCATGHRRLYRYCDGTATRAVRAARTHEPYVQSMNHHALPCACSNNCCCLRTARINLRSPMWLMGAIIKLQRQQRSIDLLLRPGAQSWHRGARGRYQRSGRAPLRRPPVVARDCASSG